MSLDERALVDRLRAGDEDTFMALVDTHGAAMLRLALSFVRSRAVAEEVVQEAWVGVLRGIDRFEGRSSLKRWLFRIVANTAKTRGEREARPFRSRTSASRRWSPSASFGGDHPLYPGGWATPPREWPEDRLAAAEVHEVIDSTIAELPPQQRQVITLRDVLGCDAGETWRDT
jgi:RNA polymerase sigma-70 factor, ECF subfamily